MLREFSPLGCGLSANTAQEASWLYLCAIIHMIYLTFVYPQCKCKPYSRQHLSPQKVTTPLWSRSLLGQ